MTRLVAILALLPPVMSLGGCGGLVAAGAAAGGIGGALTIANQVSGSVDKVIDAACAEYEKGRAAAEAVVATGMVPATYAAKIAVIEQYGDAACANPPAGDALSTAIWFGTLAGQLATLSAVKGDT